MTTTTTPDRATAHSSEATGGSVSEAEVNRRLGARIRQVREVRGMKQWQMVKGCRGKSYPTQSQYESGIRGVSIYRLLQLSEVLRVEPTIWLLDDERWGTALEDLRRAMQLESEPT